MRVLRLTTQASKATRRSRPHPYRSSHRKRRTPSGTTTGYQYDLAGQVSAMSAMLPGATKAVPLAANFAWQPYGPLAGLTYGNGIVETRGYDLSYRLGSVVTGSVQNLSYGYDGDDNATGITDAVTPANSHTLGYDNLNRLNGDKVGGATYGWMYDASGNRTAANSDTYSYMPNSNVLTGYTSGSTTTTVSRNGIGSITALTPSKGKATKLGYNAAERLASVTLGTTAELANTYDAFGRRTLKTAGKTGGVFLYDPAGHLLEERDTTGATLVRQDTVYLGGVPLADINPDTGAIFFLHTDHLGTPQVATTSQGAIAWQGTYTAFGSVTAPQGLLTQNLRFQGQYADATTGWSQNGFRDYSPTLGRYLESDPVGLAAGVNTYAYVHNNPVNLRDPLGLQPVESDPAEETSEEAADADPSNQPMIMRMGDAPAPGEPGSATPANSCPLQTGGRTISNNTANTLNNLFGTNMSRRDVGRALEDLKAYNGYGPSDHGTIMSNGDWHIDGGAVDNIGNHIP